MEREQTRRKLLLQERLKLVESRVPRPPLPRTIAPRRKCHGDVLLDEVRWLATDFVEERRWKRCAAAVLAASVRSYFDRKEPLQRAHQAAVRSSERRRGRGKGGRSGVPPRRGAR